MPRRGILLIVLFVILLVIFLVSALGYSCDDETVHIILDPGHGGDDPGAVVGEIYEKNINLSVARLVREQIEKHENVIVTMTREDDTFVSLSDRVGTANSLDADLFVSIHANSLDDTSYAGIITFYHPKKITSKKPAEMIQKNVCNATNGIDRNVRSENYAVLRETKMPAVLIETGFMTCPEELTMLINSEYQILLASGIYEGIIEYIS